MGRVAGPGKADLGILFDPTSVAIVGASEDPGKLGSHVMRSLLNGGYKGALYPVNPKRGEVMGMPSYPSLSKIPGEVDLCVMVLPAERILGQIRSCISKGVKGVVLATSGFKEVDDPRGEALQAEVGKMATEAGIPIVGPNTFGLVNRHADLNASFTPEFGLLKKGGVSLVSQSGGMCHLVAFLSMRSGIGFSKIVGLGNRCNMDFGDLIRYLHGDPATKVIALYMEGIDDPRPMMEEARRCNGSKPVIAYKVGSSTVGDSASRSHTGSMAGDHLAYRGAFRQAGILAVEGTEELLDAAKALAMCPLPQGPGVAVVTGQAGPAMAACDVCEREGLRVVRFTSETQRKIYALLPPFSLRDNPVDMGPAWYNMAALKGVIEAAIEDNGVHSVLLLMTYASANAGLAEGLVCMLGDERWQKPVVACMTAPPGVWDGEIERLEGMGALVNLPTPERAARAAAALWKARSLMASPVPVRTMGP
ncbi:MAG: acetate--CoA ligase family protein [Thermodesulfobacteriota bacterium]